MDTSTLRRRRNTKPDLSLHSLWKKRREGIHLDENDDDKDDKDAFDDQEHLQHLEALNAMLFPGKDGTSSSSEFAYLVNIFSPLNTYYAL